MQTTGEETTYEDLEEKVKKLLYKHVRTIKGNRSVEYYGWYSRHEGE